VLRFNRFQESRYHDVIGSTQNCQLRIEWRPVCVHAIWTRLVTRQICKRQQSRSYHMNANRSSINTYIYIFLHNQC